MLRLQYIDNPTVSAIVFVEPLDKGFFIVFLLHTEKYTENNYFVKC